MSKEFLDNKELFTRMPQYYKFLKRDYEKKYRKYKALLKDGTDIDKYIETREKAEGFLVTLGERHDYVNRSISFSYEFGRLSINNRSGFRVLFDGNLVLSDNCYLPGDWEILLDTLYSNRDTELLEKKRKAKTIKNVFLLEPSHNSEIIIDNSIIIKNFYNYNRSEEFISNGVSVYFNDEEVFSYVMSGYDYPGVSLNPKLLKYTSGSWEEVLDNYVRRDNPTKRIYKK